MSLLSRLARRRHETGPRGIDVRIRPHNRPRPGRGGGPRDETNRRLGLGVILAAVFYLLAHYSIIADVWPTHGTAPGAGAFVIRDAAALLAWLLLFPALRALGYRGGWAIVALPVIIFLLTRPSLFQLFTDPVYQATSATRADANALKAERSRITTILEGYDPERQALVFEDEPPEVPDPLEAVRAATEGQRSSPVRLASALSVLIAPLALLLTYWVARRQGVS